MSRFDASGGKMYVPRDRYSFKMSFCVVPAERRVRDALLVGEREVHAEQPHRGGVDRHRRVHLRERDAVEQRAHLAEVRDRHADLADLAPGERASRGRSRSGSGGRRPPRARSDPWPGSSGTARWRRARTSVRSRSGSTRGGRARPSTPFSRIGGPRRKLGPPPGLPATACTRRSRGRSCGRGARRSPSGAAPGRPRSSGP